MPNLSPVLKFLLSQYTFPSTLKSKYGQNGSLSYHLNFPKLPLLSAPDLKHDSRDGESILTYVQY